MKLDFCTSEFVRSHGKEPSRVTRGSWAFGTEKNADPSNSDKCWFSPGGMTLAEAKKWAKGEVARRFGQDAEGTLYVMP